MDRQWPLPPGMTLAALVVLLVLVAAGSVAASTLTEPERTSPDVPNELVEPRPGNNVFWPWTSTDRTVDGRTLAINVIVYGDADELRARMTDRPGATWNETDEEQEDIDPDSVDGGAEQGANATVVDWASARGAQRHLYIHSHALTREGENATVRRPHQALSFVPRDRENVGGEWVEETYQLHDGTYFGTRYHLRAYESPFASDNWTAIQAHSDHWDWFRLRHTVDGTENAQDYVESEFMGRPFVADVWRMYVYNEGSGSDGWATVIDLEGSGPPSERPPESLLTEEDDSRSLPVWPPVAGLALVAVVTGWSRIPSRMRTAVENPPGDASRELAEQTRREPERLDDGRATPPGGVLGSVAPSLTERFDQSQRLLLVRIQTWSLLFVSVCGLYLSVRAGGILLESQFPDLSPKVIAAALYPFIAIGLPVCAYVFGRPLDEDHGFVLAALGLSTAVVVDYLYLNVTLLPLDVVIHRFGVAITLGFIAAGATYPHARQETVNRWFAAGVLGWVFLLLAPLVGWL